MKQPISTSYGATASPASNRKPIGIPRLLEMKSRGEKITMLTAYDATFAGMVDAGGVECILVGDSLGMVCQGLPTTVGVSMSTMCYHTESVLRGLQKVKGTAWLISDLPFGSYQESSEYAIRNAAILMQSGAQMVKLEGGEDWVADTVRLLVMRGIPVCAHLGLTPQTVHALGGFRVQGNKEEDAKRLLRQAAILAQAGATMLVLEMVPAQLTTKITEVVGSNCITIGIGAGNAADGQVLVLHDLLGIGLGKLPKFSCNFLQGNEGILAAISAYVSAVKNASFPDNTLHAW